MPQEPVHNPENNTDLRHDAASGFGETLERVLEQRQSMLDALVQLAGDTRARGEDRIRAATMFLQNTADYVRYDRERAQTPPPAVTSTHAADVAQDPPPLSARTPKLGKFPYRTRPKPKK